MQHSCVFSQQFMIYSITWQTDGGNVVGQLGLSVESEEGDIVARIWLQEAVLSQPVAPLPRVIRPLAGIPCWVNATYSLQV
jgi:hypothetical protein